MQSQQISFLSIEISITTLLIPCLRVLEHHFHAESAYFEIFQIKKNYMKATHLEI